MDNLKKSFFRFMEKLTNFWETNIYPVVYRDYTFMDAFGDVHKKITIDVFLLVIIIVLLIIIIIILSSINSKMKPR